MKPQSIASQLHNNAIAIISLVVAIIALVLNTWRLEQTEQNRNVRQASFEMLTDLGELQAVINITLYQSNPLKSDPIQGWNYIAKMSDIVVLIPEPVPTQLNRLIDVWSSHWKMIPNDEKIAKEISTQIDLTREAVMKALHQLH